MLNFASYFQLLLVFWNRRKTSYSYLNYHLNFVVSMMYEHWSTHYDHLLLGASEVSDRYSRGRLDNKAETSVNITPNRGGAKDQGYSIKPHMSLELSFVAKGTSANVPVTFRAEDDLTGDALLINSSEEPFAGNPSDSSTEMTVATVTSSSKFNAWGVTAVYYDIGFTLVWEVCSLFPEIFRLQYLPLPETKWRRTAKSGRSAYCF